MVDTYSNHSGTAYDQVKTTAALSPTLMDAAQMALSVYEQACKEASQLEVRAITYFE